MSVVCYNCFKEIPDDSECCPFCGFDKEKNREKFPQALPFGSILSGRYITGRVLGQGGFGITYVATDHKTKSLVAIKEFFPDAMAVRSSAISVSPYSGERGENFAYGKASFLQEAKTMAEFIGNPNIVRVHSYFEENGTAYFVMEYIVGKSFQQMIAEKGGKLSWEEAVNVIAPVLNALAAVHSKGIIHRDVTPDNIYITEDGTVKLLDFGAARYSLGDVSRSLDVVLKHGFAPKEQYSRWGKQGPYTDIYCVAASLYYALTGHKPPDAIDRMERDELVLPRTVGVDISVEQENILLKALAVQPENRYQSAKEFAEALKHTIVDKDGPLLQEASKKMQVDPSWDAARKIAAYEEAISILGQVENRTAAQELIQACEAEVRKLENEVRRKKLRILILMAAVAVLAVSLLVGAVIWAVNASSRKKILSGPGEVIQYTPSTTESRQSQDSQQPQESQQEIPVKLAVNVSPDNRFLEISLASVEEYSSVFFPVWSEINGQDDVVWYEAERNSSGTWTSGVRLKDHGDLGTYYVHTYVVQGGVESPESIAQASVDVQQIYDPVLQVAVSSDRRTLGIVLSDGGAYAGVSFAVWGEANGQDDLRWYEAQTAGKGVWESAVNLADHGDLGDYTILAKGRISSWETDITSASVVVDSINAPVTKAAVSDNFSTIEITLTGAGDYTDVQFAVWGEEDDQDDIRWYVANRQNDGSWTCSVDLGAHGELGNYIIHTYGTKNGERANIYQNTVWVKTISVPAINIMLVPGSSMMKVVLSGMDEYSGLEVYVWTKENQQDDVKDYTPQVRFDGSLVAVIDLNNHPGEGPIYVHVYAQVNGESTQIAGAELYMH